MKGKERYQKMGQGVDFWPQIDFEIPETVVLENTEPIEKCEQIVRDMINPPRIVHGIPEAYYSPVSDLINMPEKRLFESQEYYFSVLFHELTHATGHQDRLNRKEVVEYNEFGSEGYRNKSFKIISLPLLK